MDEEKKPFGIVSIVILMLVAVANDGAEVFFLLLAATIVGLAGQSIMEPINLCVDGIITTWFFAKCGFGGPSLIQLLDDVLELVGVPGRTISVAVGIYLANHPSSAIGKIGQATAALETGGVAGEISEEAQLGEAAAKEAGTTAGAAAKTEQEVSAGGEVAEGEKRAPAGEEEEAEGKKAQEEELEAEMETKYQKPPEEVEKEQLLEQTPQIPNQENDENAEEEETATGGQGSNVVSVEDIRRRKQAEEVKENLEHPKAPRDVTEESSDDHGLPAAA